MKQNIKKLSVLAIILLFALSACKANIARNDDGSFTVETSSLQQLTNTMFNWCW